MKPSEDTGMDAGKLKALLSAESGETDAAWIERMKKQYPFFTLPELLALRSEASDAERRRVAGAAALSVADSSALERLATPDGMRFDDFYPEEVKPKSPTTNQAIDKFLETYGQSDDAEIQTLEKLIFNPVADYSQQLARQEESSLPDAAPTGDSQADRINRFILAVRGKERDGQVPDVPLQGARAATDTSVQKTVPTSVQMPPMREHKAGKTVPAPSGNTLLSESLAKIYVKTGRYERAYEILSHLSLAFPEKNAYFADQLRFLRKLMLVESCRQKRIDNNTKAE